MKPAQHISIKSRKKLGLGIATSLIVAATLVTSVVGLPLAQAQFVGAPSSGVALTAIPPRQGDDGSLKIAPGEKSQFTIRVRNSSDGQIGVATRASDFIVADDGFTPIQVRDDVSTRWSLADWMTLTPQTQVLEPNETGAVNVLIQVPEDALPGGHYAMITHEPMINTDQEADGELGAGSGISQKIGTLIYVIVDGPINEDASIQNLNFPKFSEFGPIPFSFSVGNDSDIHVTPRTTVEIYNMFDKKVDSIEIEPKNVFPLMSRDFEGQWNQVWGTGLYKAKLIMSYGSQGALATAETTFWLLPIKLILVALMLILIALFGVVGARKHYAQKHKSEEDKIRELERKLNELDDSNDLDRYED